MKLTCKGYCEIKNGKVVKVSLNKDYWLGTHANPIGKILPCNIVVHIKETHDQD